LAGANVWIGNQQFVTNATGVATFTVAATALGAQEALVVATAPYGGVARGWYALVASDPVLTYSSIAVTPALAGSASTITVSATNTLPVAGNATVWLSVDGTNVTGQVVSFAASQTKTVTFTNIDINGLFGLPTTIKVDIEPVPGETTTTNNSAEYKVIFSLG